MIIFPTQQNNELPPEDGVIFRTPALCHAKFGKKCREYYQSIKNENGFHECPFGFNSYVKENVIFTAILLKDRKSKKLRAENFHEDDFTAYLSSREFLLQLDKEIHIKKKQVKQSNFKVEKKN